ncbi:MAG: DUF917 family protein [Clostridium sp.]|nr:DUF917 family protein [Clostridium sp.]
MIKLTKELCLQALYGGLLLGGGGGGSIQMGLDAVEEAFRHTGELTMMDVSELDKEDIMVTVSMVGAPSAKDTCVTINHWKTLLKNFEENSGTKISGFITCENGGVSTSNGWVISAITGVPMVDAPCNGRAHPTGGMGSMGLNRRQDYVTVQSACGGKGERYVETVAKGSLTAANHLVRQTAVAAGGLCCVLRNPVTAEYASAHGAVGAIAQALAIGKGYMEHKGDVEGILDFLRREYDAEVICRGTTCDYTLCMDGGYDVGSLHVKSGDDDYELTYWNEYMTMERNGERLGTFPDLLCTLDAATGLALSSAEIDENMDVIMIKIPKNRLILGAGMYQRELLKEVEEILKKELISYNEELFV